MNNKILLWTLSILAIFGFLTIVYLATSSTAPEETFAEANTLNSTDHLTWSKNKKHILTEYSDLQCPACAQFYQYIKGTLETNKTITNNITFVYRHFPLQQHKHGTKAAYVAEAAGMQGKFYEMVDLQFVNQAEWQDLGNPDEYFEGLAKQLKLDIEKYRADIKSDTVKSKVNADLQSGRSVKVNSTPTFFLDGKKVQIVSLEQFKKLLEDTAKQ